MCAASSTYNECNCADNSGGSNYVAAVEGGTVSRGMSGLSKDHLAEGIYGCGMEGGIVECGVLRKVGG